MADIQKLNVNNTTYDISTTWSKVTGKPDTFPADTIDGCHVNNLLPINAYSFESGCLVRTDIPAASDAMVTFRIEGNAYGSLNSIFTTGNFYNYHSGQDIIEYYAIHHGCNFGTIDIFCYDGYVHLWFKQQSHYQSFTITVFTTNGGTNAINRVTRISETGLPTSGKSRHHTITPKIGVTSANISSYALTSLPSHSHDYLPTSGGTMNSNASISWADRGAWGNSSATYPYSYGGLTWSGTSDWIKLYGKEEAIDKLNLMIEFGDDTGHAIKINDCGNEYTVLHTGNIGSQSVNYATSAGSAGYATSANSASSVPWSGVSGKPALPSYYNLTGNDPTSIIKSNITSFARNSLVHAYLGHGSASFAMGWCLSGYDSGPYGGFLVNSYGDNWSFIGCSSGVWTTRTVLHSGNISSYALTSLPSHSHSYLPLSGGTVTGNIAVTGKVSAAGGFYQESDERLKTFYDPIKVDLDKLKTLRKNYFKFNDKDKLEIGVSAQEIQSLYPEIVSTNDEGYLSVAYDKLSVIALAALDEQQKEIDDLKDQLSTIKNILKEKGIL